MEFVVKHLPEAYRRALNAVGYAKRSVEIRPQQTYALQGPSGAGLRAFTCVIDLDNGTHELHYGSWGGPNMFTSLPADSDSERRVLDDSTAVLKGSMANTARYASFAVSQATYDALVTEAASSQHRTLSERARAGDQSAAARLVAGDVALEAGDRLDAALSDKLEPFERTVLDVYKTYNSGGRKNEFERMVWDKKATKASIEVATKALVARGLLKQNKAGAISITVEGRNALERK